MDDTPRHFWDELKFTILRRRTGQIALAVVLAEECIRFLSNLVWFLIIPLVANIVDTHSESVLFPSSAHHFAWIQIFGSVVEFLTVLVFVFYVNRLLYGRNRPRSLGPQGNVEHVLPPDDLASAKEKREDDYEPIVPRMFSAPEAPGRNVEVPAASGPKD